MRSLGSHCCASNIISDQCSLTEDLSLAQGDCHVTQIVHIDVNLSFVKDVQAVSFVSLKHYYQKLDEARQVLISFALKVRYSSLSPIIATNSLSKLSKKGTLNFK